MLSTHGPVAQLVAHLHGMQGVRGSSPLRSTKRNLQNSVIYRRRLPAWAAGNNFLSRALDLV